MTDNELLSRITVEPEKMSGRACIRGMRIRVVDILSDLAHGATKEDILKFFPDLEPHDIDAALLYAAKTMADLNVRPQAAE